MINRASLLLVLCCIGGTSSYAEYGSSSGAVKQSRLPLDTSGKHAYQAPSSTNRRGPCPALNALANNGYISRTGVSNAAEVFDASLKMGFATDAADVLAALAVIASNGLVFSIGQGSLTTGPGLNTHNFLEGDMSYKSCDCNLCPWQNGCDNFKFNDGVWSTTYDAAQANGNLFGIPTFKIAAKKRYDQCRANNSKCLFGPIQFIFHYATPCLMAQVFPNGTDGLPTEAIENTWIGIVKKANGVRSGVPGGGRIPDNWYPRVKPYTTQELGSCMHEIYSANPVQFGVSINGKFVPDKTQLPPNPTKRNIACFVYRTLASAASATLLPAVTKYLNRAFVTGPWKCTSY